MTFSTSAVAVCWSKRLAQLAEQPRVLDGDDGLVGKRLPLIQFARLVNGRTVKRVSCEDTN